MSSSDLGRDIEWLVRKVLFVSLFLLFTATLSAPFVLILNAVYKPAAHPFVFALIMAFVGYWLWKTVDWK